MADDGTQLLEELMRFKPDGLTANAWAVRAGVSRTIWSDLRRHGNPSRRTLSKLLAAAGSSLAEFEALRIGRSVEPAGTGGMLADSGHGWGQSPLAPLPLWATKPGGWWGNAAQGAELLMIEQDNAIDRLARPPSLATDRGAYAVTIVGEFMWPRFRTGRRVAVSPSAPVGAGSDVLVQLTGGQGALIGELQSQTSTAVRLRQFNPPSEFDVPADSVAAVHKILGELF